MTPQHQITEEEDFINTADQRTLNEHVMTAIRKAKKKRDYDYIPYCSACTWEDLKDQKVMEQAEKIKTRKEIKGIKVKTEEFRGMKHFDLIRTNIIKDTKTRKPTEYMLDYKCKNKHGLVISIEYSDLLILMNAEEEWNKTNPDVIDLMKKESNRRSEIFKKVSQGKKDKLATLEDAAELI